MVARHRLRSLAIIGLLLVVILLSGCYFNIFQTARTVGAGKVAISVGSGVVNIVVGQDSSLIFTPQARLTVGLSDSVDLGVQSGLMIGASGSPSFLGAIGDIKMALVQDPETFSLALGIGGGYSPSLLGWGVEGSVYLDSNIVFLPIYAVYRPILPLSGTTLGVIHQVAGGLHLDLSDSVRILIEVDSWNGVLGGGISLDIIF
ncbi:hypothetical protein KAT59_08355 [Candidatus Bipolaricaulota bacterium]|nr:hypothetical protein [Candidatus Bipolaricaulota bacterium]MCK4683020.1 hypothetical protein [Candidatus Bipolaricaulota bacterium]